MIALGLDAKTERPLFDEQLRSTSRVRTTLTLLDLSGKSPVDLTDRLLGGQVNIDATAETSRQLSCTLDDPDHELHLDSDAPGDGALYADRMLQAHYGFWVEGLGRWVDVPVFTGPITSMKRDGGVIDLGCLGKEHLAGGQAWRPLTLRKGTNVVRGIRTILAERAGETEFSFPTTPHRIPRGGYTLGKMTSPWLAARELANSIGRHLYYDGAGVCRLRKPPKGSVYTFDGAVVLGDPSITYDLSTIVNTVWVKGHKPEGKPRVSASVTAPRTHPLSPQRLGRNSEPRYLVAEVDAPKVRSAKDARALARDQLKGYLREGLDVSFDSLPIPHLDPLDVVRLNAEGVSITFTLRAASIALTHDGSMSVGTNKRVAPNRKGIRG